MIRNFVDAETEKIFRREPTKHFSNDVQRSALRKLLILNAATSLDELRVPPGNRLEKLLGERRGQYSIRVNRQYRICFMWKAGTRTMSRLLITIESGV